MAQMRARIATTVVVSLFLLFLQSCRTVPVNGRASPVLAQLTLDVGTAFVARDEAKLRSLVDENCQLHWIDHERQGASLFAQAPGERAPWFIALARKTSVVPLQKAVVESTVYGNVGIVISHYKWQATVNGAQFRGEGYAHHVWLNRGGEWKLVSISADVLPPWNWR